PTEVIDRLLADGRVLVIIDGYSEMAPDTRARIDCSILELAAQSVVITTRGRQSQLQRLNPLVVEIPGVDGAELARFYERYFRLKRKPTHLQRSDLLAYASNFSKLVRERSTPVLFAVLYADQLIDCTQGAIGSPHNMPDLVLSFLNRLNREVRGE